ncbi:MAG: TonB-dependent receptor, partial [Gammaproteobacteria bacterium]|nr:TonB-dependent receptor [Gammaproteobacteria bacterium]
MATASAQDGAIDEMVVSARFREESLQDTPLAITAVSGAEMELRGLTDVTDLDAFSPSTVIAPLGAGWGSTAAAFIRGVGLGDNSLSFEPGVPIYIDDVYHGRPQGAIMDLLDLERVEVLRGPQGTLFGRNAIGGTVRLVSRKPQGDNSGNIEIQMGSYDQLNVRGGVDVSLVEDQLMLRVSGSSKQRDGYFKLLDYECVNGPGTLGDGGTAPVQVATDIDGAPVYFEPIVLGSELGSQDIRTENGCVVDTLGDENVQSGRAALRWIVSDAMELNVIGDVTHLRQKGPADKYTLMNGDFGLWTLWNNLVAGPVYGNDPDGNPIRWDDRFMTDSPYTAYLRYADDLTNRRWENVNNMDHWGVSASMDWDLTDTIHLKSVTAFRKFTNTYGRDSDGSPLPL